MIYKIVIGNKNLQSDNCIIINNVPFTDIPIENVDSGIWAFDFDTDTNQGMIEFQDSSISNRMVNSQAELEEVIGCSLSSLNDLHDQFLNPETEENG